MPENAWQKFEKLYFRFFPLVLRRVSAETWKDQLLSSDAETDRDTALAISLCAFHRVLSGRNHPQYDNALAFLHQTSEVDPLTRELRDFLRQGIRKIRDEIEQVALHDSEFADRLDATYRWLEQAPANVELRGEVVERFWKVFFPEGVGILGREGEAEEALRRKRRVKILEEKSMPVREPSAEILFTSNVLLTIPLKNWKIDRLPLTDSVKRILKEHANDPQEFWYDHPIPVGIPPEQNEVLYGLRGLNEMMAFEKVRGTADKNQRLTVVLSCSVTHSFLHEIARDYLQQTIRQAGGFEHLDVYLFTEQDVRDWLRIFFSRTDKLWEAVGVDGPYGRHYSFLKAISAWWQVFVNPALKATFKIDLDQVFDQERLVQETGQSALEHFRTALWGSDGLDADGNPVRLGMIAGALVNAEDIAQSLFTPDVPYPPGPRHADEFVFFSRLPQALSTQAEMMTRYDSPQLDGKRFCLQRVHVTGGTNGILIDALRRFKPFTPSFIGRAEDQAYLLSTMTGRTQPLAYLHKAGLIMRHDKELFAREAIHAAEIGKMIGDYERILYFSKYAQVLNKDYRLIKDRVDPFTGCFISSIPQTIVFLRFVFKLLDFLQRGQIESAKEFITIGIPRLKKAMDFCEGENSPLQKQYEKERAEWNAYYQTLEWLERRVHAQDDQVLKLKTQASHFVRNLQIV